MQVICFNHLSYIFYNCFSHLHHTKYMYHFPFFVIKRLFFVLNVHPERFILRLNNHFRPKRKKSNTKTLSMTQKSCHISIFFSANVATFLLIVPQF